jgi:hypothetical protein
LDLRFIDLFVGGDASAAVDGASGVGELDLEVRFVGLGGVVADVIVVVERDVVVVALNEASGGSVVVVGREGQTGVLGDLEDGLDEAFAEGGFADDEGAVVVLQGAGDDLSRGGGVAVDEDDDRVFVRTLLAVGGAVDLVGEGAAALGDDDLAFLEELVGHVDGFVEQSAGVAAEVDDEAFEFTGGLELVEGVAYLAAGGLHKVGDVDVADAGLELEGQIDGVAWNLVADQVEDEGLG